MAIDSLPTLVAYSDAPTQPFQFLSALAAQRLVGGSGGGHKVYIYTTYDETVLGSISLATFGADRTTSYSQSATTNVYWNGVNEKGQRRATVGADLMLMTEDDICYNQYIDVNHGPNVSTGNKAHCALGATPPYIDSGGELRNSTYWLALTRGGTKSYYFNGVEFYWAGSQIVAVVFTVQRGRYGGVDKSSITCQVPLLTAPNLVYDYDWALRNPPPTNTVPGDYSILPTVSANAKTAGTGAIQFNQVFSQGVIPPPPGNVTVTFTSSVPNNFLTVQTATVTDQNGAVITGVPYVFYECQSAGCTSTSGSGYHSGISDQNGQIVYDNHLPAGKAHLYRDWVTVTVNGVKYSSKICEIVTDASGGGTAVCGL